MNRGLSVPGFPKGDADMIKAQPGLRTARQTVCRGSLFYAFAITWIFPMLSSCSLKRNVPADPKLVEAFRNADQTLDAAGSGSAVSQSYSGEVEAAIEALMNELANQKSRYTNPRQGADLHRLVQDLGELMTQAANLGWNPSGDQLDGLYRQWRNIRPRVLEYAGPADKQ